MFPAIMETHIGDIIEKLLRQKPMSVSELATEIKYTPQAVYRMLKRKMLHPFLLEEISKALNHNLFQYVYQPSKEWVQQNEGEKLQNLRKENDDLKKENAYLREINELLKGKRSDSLCPKAKKGESR